MFPSSARRLAYCAERLVCGSYSQKIAFCIRPPATDSKTSNVYITENNSLSPRSRDCWYLTGTDSFASKLIRVEAGKPLTGVIKLLSQTNSLASYSCEFTGIAKSKLTVNNIAPLAWLAEVLEVYSVDTCTDFPNAAFSEMSKINVKIKKTSPPVACGS